ncbi:hypothetical protein HN873_047018 [Arachis hypogaea]
MDNPFRRPISTTIFLIGTAVALWLGVGATLPIEKSNVQVGGATLGRIFNVLGEPIDNLGPVDTRTTSPIHRSAPAFIQLDTFLSREERNLSVQMKFSKGYTEICI